MNKRSLIWYGAVLMCAAALGGGHPVSAQSTFGQAIPLPGSINEVVIDEARGLVYAGNFAAGRVEVVSMATNQRIGAFPSAGNPGATTGMAISPDSRWLVTTNLQATNNVPALSGVTVIDLNNTRNRRHFPFGEQVLAIAFAADGEALIITTESFQLFDPVDGSFRTLFDLEDPGANILLPVPPPVFPREIVRASAGASGDGRWIFGATDSFVFSYQVRQPVGLLTIRMVDTLVNPPVFDTVSASLDGSYFLVGQLMFTRDLRVMADTPAAPPENANFIGGHVVDQGVNTVYASFDVETGTVEGEDGHPISGILHVMDADNLYIRQQLRLRERIVGRIALGGEGRFLYAASESGLLHLPLSDLANLPQLEVNPEDRNILFAFDFCDREPIVRMLRIESPPGGAEARFSLSVEPLRTGPRTPVLFEPQVGVTPATVRVTVDPGALGPRQGNTTMPVMIETDAVNIPRPANIVASMKDVDQKGNFIQVPGRLVDIIGDPFRDRVYVLDQQNFLVHMLDTNELRVIGSFRTGNTPSAMTMTADGRFLAVANSRAENITLIDLAERRVEGLVFLPWQTIDEGHYPLSIAADLLRIVVASRTSEGEGELDFISPSSRAVSSPDALGIFWNDFDPELAIVNRPDYAEILIATASGQTFLYESLSNRIIIGRSDFDSLQGAVGAGPNYYMVDNHVVNQSLVPLVDFDDAAANNVSSGFALLPDGTGVRNIRPVTQVDTGAVQQLDPRDPTRLINAVRPADPPPPPGVNTPFSRSLSTLRDGRLVATSSAGVIEFPLGYDQGLDLPSISAVTNAADFTNATAAGGLISVFGENLAPETASATELPLPRKLANVCVTANGGAVPLLFVSPNQINAQLDFNIFGPVSAVVHTPGGLSNIFVTQVDPAAPAVFSVPGPDSSRFAAVFRAENNQLATLSNPLRPNEIAIIYATGLGPVTPIGIAGFAAPMEPLTTTVETPTVTIGGVEGEVQFSGLAPGFVGLYQLNVRLPGFVPRGMQVPVTISSSTHTTTLNVRIVE